MRELASRLLFTLRKEGWRFCLYREADVPQPVRHDDLALDEVEETLNTWKPRGPHGADVAYATTGTGEGDLNHASRKSSEANPQRGGPDRSLFVARASPRQS